MHELRKDPLLNRWVAVLRDSKPPDYYAGKVPAGEGGEAAQCLLCPGCEDKTTTEIFAIRDGGASAGASGWRTRVIPRVDPIFQIEGELGRRGVGIYDKMNSVGANEIIIESPRHGVPAEDMGVSQMTDVIRTYRHRISELEKDARLRYSLLYKDEPAASGDLYRHPCSQIVATPVIPKGIKEELDGAKAYYYYKERCLFCDIVNDELSGGDRTIMETGYFIAFTPFAPRFPFEYSILPKRHCCAFQDMSDGELEDFSLILSVTLRKMKALLKNPPYSYVVHTAPNRVPRKDHWHTLGDDFHWHLEVTPRLVFKSGFELGSEFYILTTSPEDAARYLREA